MTKEYTLLVSGLQTVIPGCESVMCPIFLNVALAGDGVISDPKIIVGRRFTFVFFGMEFLDCTCMKAILEITCNISFDFVGKVAGKTGGLASINAGYVVSIAMADSVNVPCKVI